MAARVHLVLYDGDCALCNRLTRFVVRRDRHDRFRFTALQSERGRAIVKRLSGDPHDLSTFHVVADHDAPHARLMSRGRAALFVLDQLGGAWRAANLLRVLPTRVLDWGYGLVAKNRQHLLRGACPLPPPESRWKFL